MFCTESPHRQFRPGPAQCRLKGFCHGFLKLAQLGVVTCLVAVRAQSAEKYYYTVPVEFAYQIMVVDGGSVKPVSRTHMFVKGEMFRIEVTPAIDGFLAVLQGGDSQASARRPILYPERESDGRVKAGERLQLPMLGAKFFRIVDSPTQITIILSRTRLELPAGPTEWQRFRETLKRPMDAKVEEFSLRQK